MSDLINNISPQISPESAGIIWVTDEKLSLSTPGLYEINYLFNGLIVKSIINRKDAAVAKDNYFISENFGNQLTIHFRRKL
jgi:hypothetical protein